MKVFIKGISTVLSYFFRLGLYAVMAALSGYAVANAFVFSTNSLINSKMGMENINYVPFSLFYQSALKLLSDLATGLCVLFILATVFSIAFEYVMAKYKFQHKGEVK
ncbi:hypothetical protein CH62_4338 (plasmid) [Yersinia pestis]|uniref:Uncharacterized protein n=1 Tax=Yersinia pestis Java 9 TaxID=880632 RepID=E8PSE3_YERPE|nr:hypothetical protein [Yersinia pestis]ADW66943.1 hypothetical protein YPJ_pJARS3619 [Yersinia pestis Java 9]AJJ37990.1 hypothetical protein CH62_4338 [Yersinia pestis]ROZ98391.1 hypothetical protein EGT46_00975 [Yersinia pestis]